MSVRRIELGTNIALVLVLLGILGFYIHDRRIRPREAVPRLEPVMVTGWEEETGRGIMIGPADAPVTIVEFMDFQCPFCADFARRVDSLRSEFASEVRVVFHHYPLPSHPMAIPAAIASECAVRQGVFESFVGLVFQHQSELGTRSWPEFARDAGVSDMDRFEACTRLPVDSFPRIAYGRELAARTGATGTPTVWVDGWMQPFPPTLERLRAVVRESRE